MIGVEVTITLGYPEDMDVDAVQVALANLGDALDKGAFADVQLLCASARRVEEDA